MQEVHPEIQHLPEASGTDVAGIFSRASVALRSILHTLVGVYRVSSRNETSLPRKRGVTLGRCGDRIGWRIA
jgi:hypothetical protein